MSSKKALLLANKIVLNVNYASQLTIEEIRLLLKEFQNIVQAQPMCKTINSGSVIVVGDIHGDFAILKEIVQPYLEKKSLDHLIFLGDIVDRGSQSIACLNLLFALVISYPNKVHFLRGNHEARNVNSRYGFSEEVSNFSPTSDLFEEYNTVFADIPLTLIHRKLGIIFLHGGIPITPCSYQTLLNLPRGDKFLQNPVIMQLLWNDPKEDVDGFTSSMRGEGIYYFGQALVKAFLRENNLKTIIRAHEAFSEGFKFFFNNQLLSIFSSEEHYQIDAKIIHITTKNKLSILSVRNKKVIQL